MNLFDELAEIARALDDAGINYAVVGGIAIGIYLQPRSTLDLDLLILEENLPDGEDPGGGLSCPGPAAGG